MDAGDAGICLFGFCGDASRARGEIQAGEEGAVEWVKKEAVLYLPVVEDLPILLDRIHRMKRSDPPFSARSFYDTEGKLQVLFSE